MDPHVIFLGAICGVGIYLIVGYIYLFHTCSKRDKKYKNKDEREIEFLEPDIIFCPKCHKKYLDWKISDKRGYTKFVCPKCGFNCLQRNEYWR